MLERVPNADMPQKKVMQDIFYQKISPTTHLGVCGCVWVCVCVCSFERVVAGKKPLNLSQRKCIYKTLHLIIRLKVTLRSLPNNMDD